ncbi:hypothetical protein L9F63_011931, partial [Diploptera punctata]
AVFKMSSRSVLGRPRRTKVYDCNFTAGERYYKPVVDSLDRKGGASSSPDRGGISSLRSNLLAEAEAEPVSFRRRTPRIDDDYEIDEPRRKANSALMDEYDSIFENRHRSVRSERSPNRSIRTLEDEADKEISSYLKRMQEKRVARKTYEDEFEAAVTPRDSKRRHPIDFQEKLLDTIGLKNADVERATNAIENDSFFKKRTLKITTEEDEEAPSFTKWTALKSRAQEDGESEDFGSAAARARRTRNRIKDLDAEMEELTNKTAAREKRVAQLRAFLKDTEDNGAESSMQSSRVVQKATVRSEKKTVTF